MRKTKRILILREEEEASERKHSSMKDHILMTEGDSRLRMNTMIEDPLPEDTIMDTEMIAEDASTKVLSTPKISTPTTRSPEQVATAK